MYHYFNPTATALNSFPELKIRRDDVRQYFKIFVAF